MRNKNSAFRQLFYRLIEVTGTEQHSWSARQKCCFVQNKYAKASINLQLDVLPEYALRNYQIIIPLPGGVYQDWDLVVHHTTNLKFQDDKW